MENENNAASLHSLLFIHLIAMFQSAAMQQLGKLPNPLTNEIERDLEQAKMSIDILDMLKAKTSGNLSTSEQDFIDKVVFELHMNYVDEARKPAEPESSGEQDAVDGGSDPAASQKAEETAEKQTTKSGKSKARKTKPKGGTA
jgi:hypothetical protein